jgi:hypothetical protein
MLLPVTLLPPSQQPKTSIVKRRKTKIMIRQSLANLITRACLHSPILIALVCFALPTTLRAAEPCANCGFRGNTSLGTAALENQTGNTAADVAIGFAAMQSTTSGQRNTSVGDSSLRENTAGNDNTAIGYQALLHNQANLNTATGKEALASNTTGDSNVANGAGALAQNSTGSDNTAVGFRALVTNTSGRASVAIGSGALGNNVRASEIPR